MIPSCKAVPRRSGTPQCSTMRPSTTRMTSNTSVRIGRPVAGWPMKGPSWVPVPTIRSQTVVAVHDRVLDGQVEVGERPSQRCDHGFHAFPAGSVIGAEVLVLDQIGRREFVGDVEV